MLLSGVPAFSAGLAEGLAAYRGKSRVLVIRVQRLDQIALARQKQILRADEPGLAERDMVVFAGTRDAVLPIFGEAPAGMPALSAPPGGFEAVLVGKDGTVKGRWNQPVTLPELFSLIDAMPMRRQEMRTRGG
ncbi:MAG: DUF4174 domain-containing protein [Rhodobiaceae bacterium]|nr:DUF4174 domain-containing protein [Rhodobiaceae bacterium]